MRVIKLVIWISLYFVLRPIDRTFVSPYINKSCQTTQNTMMLLTTWAMWITLWSLTSITWGYFGMMAVAPVFFAWVLMTASVRLSWNNTISTNNKNV